MKLRARSTHKRGPKQREAWAYFWKLCIIERGKVQLRFLDYIASRARSFFPFPF